MRYLPDASAQFLRCTKMLRVIIPWIVATTFLTMSVSASPSERVLGARMFLNNGSPVQAIETAQGMLSDAKVSDEDRLALLKLIAEAEEFRAKVSHYEDVKKAVTAFQTLIKEFPDDVKIPALLWKIAWMYWQQGKLSDAMAIGLQLQNRYSGSAGETKSWLMYARIHILQRKFSEARNDLLQYGVRIEDGTRQQAQGHVWMAMVDHAEKRLPQALDAMQEVYRGWPEIIASNQHLYATFIALLHAKKQFSQALNHADRFLNRYVDGRDYADVRLVRADLWREKGTVSVTKIEKEYSILASQEAETLIGKKAFMRKLMLQQREITDYRSLKPVVIAMKRVARANQFSEIETEANLNQARLWKTLIKSDPENTPKQALNVALQHYMRVASEKNLEFSPSAKTEGKVLFVQSIKQLLDEKLWVKAVVMWERFPTLRPSRYDSRDLRFQVARGLRILLEYDQAEGILDELYEHALGSVWGHKVMLERAQLWLDRGDEHAIRLVMTWLNEHEFTLYRPEMLLLVARMQLKAGDASAASQSMVSVSPEDVAMDKRAEYWKTRAEIAEVLTRWNVAAHAWRQYLGSSGPEAALGLIRQAKSLFKAESYAKAELLFAKVDKEARDASWQYHYAMSQMHTGKTKQAVERLEALKLDGQAGMFASLASLALADKQAIELLRGKR